MVLHNGAVTRGQAQGIRCALCQVQLVLSLMAEGHQPGKERTWVN